MRLEPASPQAVRFACKYFHYSKRHPQLACSYSVFNSNGDWCGVICYSYGSNRYLAKNFGMVQGMVCELTRVALNGKQESTSKALGISLRLLKKHNPLLKLVVSYADCDQAHLGIIYQATNWHYIGQVEKNGGTPKYKLFGRVIHGRSIASMGYKQNLDWLREHIDPNTEKVSTLGKHKYVYVLDKSYKALIEEQSEPYPKHAAVA